MATTNLVQLMDGPTDVVYRYFFKSDGVSGELNNFVLLDPAWLTKGDNTQPYLPPGPYTSGVFNIQCILYNLSNFTMEIGFQSANTQSLIALVPSVDSFLDFRPLSGMPDQTPIGDTPTGRIGCSTNGFSSVGQTGFMMMKVRKVRNSIGLT